MKNFDSVSQLQCFSYTCITVLQDRVMAHIHVNVATRFCKGVQLAALLQCGSAGHGFGGLVQQLQDQHPEPLVWTVNGVLTEQ